MTGVKKISSYINFLDQKKDRISNLRKVQNKNFSVLSKHDIPRLRKYYIVF